MILWKSVSHCIYMYIDLYVYVRVHEIFMRWRLPLMYAHDLQRDTKANGLNNRVIIATRQKVELNEKKILNLHINIIIIEPYSNQYNTVIHSIWPVFCGFFFFYTYFIHIFSTTFARTCEKNLIIHVVIVVIVFRLLEFSELQSVAYACT